MYMHFADEKQSMHWLREQQVSLMFEKFQGCELGCDNGRGNGDIGSECVSLVLFCIWSFGSNPCCPQVFVTMTVKVWDYYRVKNWKRCSNALLMVCMCKTRNWIVILVSINWWVWYYDVIPEGGIKNVLLQAWIISQWNDRIVPDTGTVW